MVRDVQVGFSGMRRLRAMLAAMTSLLLAFVLAPGFGGQTIRDANVHVALANAAEGTFAAPDRALAKRPQAATPGADAADIPGRVPPVMPGTVSRIVPSFAARDLNRPAAPDLPPARGPPVAVA